jgi:hypothetical protein
MRRRTIVLSLAAVVIVALVVLSLIDHLLVDYLWYGRLGYGGVFNTTVGSSGWSRSSRSSRAAW